MPREKKNFKFELICDGNSFGFVSCVSHNMLHAYATLTNELKKRHPLADFDHDFIAMKILISFK